VPGISNIETTEEATSADDKWLHLVLPRFDVFWRILIFVVVVIVVIVLYLWVGIGRKHWCCIAEWALASRLVAVDC